MHTKESLKRDLAAMKLAPEDTVLIHSSMKSIGEVEGKADTVLDALMEYFAPGLVVFPTLSFRVVNAEHPVFSVKDTPCSTGILPELFRKRPGVRRSLAPTHSLSAYGKDAADFVAGYENFDSPAHPDSPWGKLYKRNAYILFVGTGIGCNTYLHGVEEWLPVSGMLTETHQMLEIIDENGNVRDKSTEVASILDTTYADEDYAICVQKGNSQLLEDLNRALDALTKDGTIDAIINKYIK